MRIIARDTQRNIILLTGVGFAKAGTMWFDENPSDKDREGYAEAPVVDALTIPDDMGSVDMPYRNFWFNLPTKCGGCNGWGRLLAGDSPIECAQCEGTGKISIAANA